MQVSPPAEIITENNLWMTLLVMSGMPATDDWHQIAD